MTMAPGLRKFALTAHIISSVGLLGAIDGFLALAVVGLISPNDQTVRAAFLAMELSPGLSSSHWRSLHCWSDLSNHSAPLGVCSDITGSW